jgi:hypothetical protein
LGKENRLFENSLFFVIGGVIFGHWKEKNGEHFCPPCSVSFA